MDYFKIETEILKQEIPLDWYDAQVDGALVTFYGTVKSENHQRKVVHLEFEAYQPMVIRQLELIAKEIRQEFPVSQMLLIHRIGVVKPGEIAVIAAASSVHREQAFKTCERIMNELKKSVPIWKKEVFSDGETWVSAFP